jgi:hypothetical protein
VVIVEQTKFVMVEQTKFGCAEYGCTPFVGERGDSKKVVHKVGVTKNVRYDRYRVDGQHASLDRVQKGTVCCLQYREGGFSRSGPLDVVQDG